MTPKVFRGKLKNGKITPEGKLPQTSEDVEIRIMVLSPLKPTTGPRHKFFGSMKGQWGDGVKYQRKIRKELERD